MRFVRYHADSGTRLGVVDKDRVVDVWGDRPDAPRDVGDLVRSGEEAMSFARGVIREGKARAVGPLSGIACAIPVEASRKFLCLGLNYTDHVAESTHPAPEYPILFMRAPTSLIAHGEAMIRPSASDNLDYEAELAVVIGRTMRHVSPAQALGGVAGYACFNDGSVRDYQKHSIQWTMGKNFDSTGGFGPIFVTADELPPGASGLKIEARVNGETRQSNNTKNMIFSVADSIAYISRGITLEPGDVIAMGTCSGIAAAFDPPKWLRPGDVVDIEIEGIGMLRNTVADETTTN
ncbi:fumarylacetoacetate hydrolase family protein [Rhodopseudomonas sp.]|uniref:fumarylacetoacetate hydrolase family protein n=1 Tax=Rhodopseudomonas sp. TaxID=1078 RepID=UPI003B3A986C